MKIGIIGVGMVGGAIKQVAEATGKLEVRAYDKYKKIGKLDDMLGTDLVFVSVPTPTDDGLQDLSALRDVLTNLNVIAYPGVVVVKCTVLPGTMDHLSTQYEHLQLAHNPEFLTERNAAADFAKQPAILVSCHFDSRKIIEDVYQLMLDAPFYCFGDYRITETAKYMHNCFLATKVSFMNEFYDFCENKGITYESVARAAISQGVIGASHMKVPGPDGQRGFGGACFPKDTEALINGFPFDFSILKAAVKYNKQVKSGN